jgi:hypothetical protein
MRMYNVTLAPTQKAYSDNKKKPMLKMVYDEYLQIQKLVSEKQLISLLKTGRVRSCEYKGFYDED